MSKEVSDPEVECLKLKKAINENYRLSQKAAADAVDRGVLVGQMLAKWKELLPHGRFEPFVGTHFEGSIRTAQLYMQAAKRLAETSNAQRNALLAGEVTVKGLIGPLARGPSKPKKPKGKPAAVGTASTPASAASGPASDAATSNGTHDLGKCPVCGGTKWSEDEFGMSSCARCKQPHGEPAGEVEAGSKKEQAKIERLKLIKTIEAGMRTSGDLNDCAPRPSDCAELLRLFKLAIRIAKEWPTC